MKARIARLAGQPHVAWIAAGIAVLLTAHSLGFGLFADDHVQRAKLLRSPALTRLVDPVDELFVFFDGSEAEYEEGSRLGAFTWWQARGLKASFWRPLAARTHQLDYALWPDRPWLMHLHSLAWFGLAVLAVGLLYRRLLGAGSAAGLAALMFAVEDSHAAPAAWLANRNACIAIAAGAAVVFLHDRWRRDGWRPALPLALLLLIVALLSGEIALATSAWLFAYAVWLERGTLARRLATLVPYAFVCGAWLAVYRAGGYGTYGSLAYVDPLSPDFPLAVTQRVPTLLLSQWLQLPADIWVALPYSGQWLFAGLGALVMLALGWLFAPTLRSRPEARFFTTAMLLSLLPVCASFPMDRLLLFVGAAAFGLLAVAAEQQGWWQPPSEGGSPGRRRLLGALIVLHLFVAAVLLPVRAVGTRMALDIFERAADSAPDDAALADQQLVFVNGAAFLSSFMLAIRSVEERVVPRRMELLGHMANDIQVRRPGPSTLTLRVDGGWLGASAPALLRSPKLTYEAGERIERPAGGPVVTIEEVTDDGRPLLVSFEFPVVLEDPSLRWMFWQRGELVPFEVPPVGAEIVVPHTFPALR